MKLITVAVILLILAACAPVTAPENSSGREAVTAAPTVDMSSAEALCRAAADYWERDWPLAIRALEGLHTLAAECTGEAPLDERLYTAYVTYATLLEGRKRNDEAIRAYESALLYSPQGQEAADGMRRLDVSTSPALLDCASGQVDSALALIPPYTPSAGDFITIEDNQLMLDGRTFPVHGVVYYPRDTPGMRFLTAYDAETINRELDLIHDAGLNTLRIRLRQDVLFTCPGSGAVPIPDAFDRLDALIQAAAARDFHLILTLNDHPDLTNYPLYNNPRSVVEQMVYLATRYRDEPAVLAWDLREGGDQDYQNGTFERRTVLEWLVDTAVLVRRVDSHHLITASWEQDAEATIPAVDFVSFQHFGDVESLRQQIAILTAATSKPILLSAAGYSTYQSDERTQADLLQQMLDAAEKNHLAGWLVWTAFDFPLSVTCTEPNCPGPDSAENHYGLWNSSYFPKRAVEAIQMETGAH
ncbi:MAG: glycoside hydrolase family 5 protein [Anaerolineae bacterium]|nr:glycoside hydrolase family 5 protein [Anaerolineae bacterium]